MSMNNQKFQQIADALKTDLKAQFNAQNIGVNAHQEMGRYVVSLVNTGDYEASIDPAVVAYAQQKVETLAPQEDVEVKAVSYPVSRGVPQFFHPR